MGKKRTGAGTKYRSGKKKNKGSDHKAQLTPPEQFSLRMKEMLSGDYERYEASCLRQRRAGLRINTLKQNWEAFVRSAPFLQEPVPWADAFSVSGQTEPADLPLHTAYYCDPLARPGKMVLHEAGAFYMQEPSAMAVAALSGVRPGQRVLDLCAAPGGKSTQLASMMQGEGLLVSNEIHPVRAGILSQNIERMGITNAVVTNEPPARLADRFALYFDTVIVDAPCSGEGMFFKEKEAIPNWSPEAVAMCALRQREILKDAADMVAPGGRLVYSTCTFSPQEDEENTAWFLNSHPDFEIEDLPSMLGEDKMRSLGLSRGNPGWISQTDTEESSSDDGSGADGSLNMKDSVLCAIRLWPHELEGEGHYVAVFRRRTDPVPRREDSEVSRGLSGDTGWDSFCAEALRPDSERVKMIRRRPSVMFGSELYSLPCPFDLSGLKVLRPGLHLGTVKKGRFEPAHALALALTPDDVLRNIELAESGGEALPGESAAARAFLRGESLHMDTADEPSRDAGEQGQKGWCLVSSQGYPLGWGKAAGGQIKNHYPKGLRRFH